MSSGMDCWVGPVTLTLPTRMLRLSFNSSRFSANPKPFLKARKWYGYWTHTCIHAHAHTCEHAHPSQSKPTDGTSKRSQLTVRDNICIFSQDQTEQTQILHFFFHSHICKAYPKMDLWSTENSSWILTTCQQHRVTSGWVWKGIDDDDCLYIALFSDLEWTHCTCMWFYRTSFL